MPAVIAASLVVAAIVGIVLWALAWVLVQATGAFIGAPKPDPLTRSELVGEWYLDSGGVRASTMTLDEGGTFDIDQLPAAVFGEGGEMYPYASGEWPQTRGVSGTWVTDSEGDLHLTSAELGSTELALVQSWDRVVFFQRNTLTAADHYDITCYIVGRTDNNPGGCVNVKPE